MHDQDIMKLYNKKLQANAPFDLFRVSKLLSLARDIALARSCAIFPEPRRGICTASDSEQTTGFVPSSSRLGQ